MEIICSIGPNIKRKEDLAVLAEGGMTAARFNFSHIRDEDYQEISEEIKYLRSNYPSVTIIQDLQGSKLRIYSGYPREFMATKGQEIYFCTESYYTSKRALAEEFNLIPISSTLSRFNFDGVTALLIKDRTMEFELINTSEDCQVIKTVVKRGGIIRAEKGVNAIGLKRLYGKLSLKDKKDIVFGLENNVDIMAMSYTLDPVILLELKNYIKQARVYNKTAKFPKIWAKIECLEGIKALKEIVRNCDGIMLGRGDLFAELSPLDIAYHEEQVVSFMKRSKKPLIIATYVLDTMKNNSIPSLAEINEIYRYIKENVGGFMLVGEVSSGKHPKEALEFLASMVKKYTPYSHQL